MSAFESSEVAFIKDCWRTIGVWGNDSPRCERLQAVLHCHNCDVFHAASQDVYARPIPVEYRAEWSALLATEKQAAGQQNASVMVFRIGDEWVGMSGALLKEISDMRKIHKIPHNRSRVLRGLINIGGEIELCFSMGALLGIQKAQLDDERGYVFYNRVVVVDWPSGRFVFPVSEIGGILQFAEHEVQPVPSTVSACTGTYMRGVVNWERGHVGLLDAELLFTALERELR